MRVEEAAENLWTMINWNWGVQQQLRMVVIGFNEPFDISEADKKL